MKKCWTILFLLLTSGALWAQQEVSGVINDTDSNPLSGVLIMVKGTNISAASDSDGKYSIIIPQGKKALTFKKKGYQVKTVEVNNMIINIVLTPSDSDLFELTLEELLNMEIVTASKYGEKVSSTPATVMVLSKHDLESRGYVSLSDVLHDVPGYDIASAYGNLTQLAYARGNRTGSYSERTMLMIDGVESNILYAQNMNISYDFPLSAIERIEIIYGPASAIYGPNVFSGIINIITKSAEDLENKKGKAYVNTGVGTNNTQYAEMTYLAKYEPFELSLSYRRYKSDMFSMVDEPGYFGKNLFGNEQLWGPYAEAYPEFNNALDDNALLAKLKINDLELGYNHLLTKHGNGSEYPYDKTMPTTNWQFGRDIMYLRYRKDITSNFGMTLLATYENNGVIPESTWGDGSNASDDWNSDRTVKMRTWKYMSQRWSVFQDFEYQATEDFKLIGGVKFTSAQFQKSYEHTYSDVFTWAPGTYQKPDNPPNIFPQPLGSGVREGNTFINPEWGGFVQAKYSVKDIANIVAGIRYDNNEIYGEIISPRIGVTVSATKDIHFKLSYGTGFQPPPPRNLYAGWGGLVVSEDLEPDEIQSLDFSTLLKFGDFSADLTVFWSNITNSVLQGENLPDKNIIGAECKLNYFPIKSGDFINDLLFQLNYSFLDAKYADARTSSVTGRTSDLIGDVAPHKLNFIINADFLDHFHLNLRTNFVDKRPTTITNPVEEVDGFLISHLNFQVTNLLGGKVTLFMNVNNIFDTKYYHPGMDAANAGEDLTTPSDGWYSSRLPQPGRTFIGGLRFTL